MESDSHLDTESLQELSFKMVFRTFPLEKRRRIALDLLDDAELVTGVLLPEVNGDFIKWICSGKVKVWPKKEVARMWEVWNFALLNSGGGHVDIEDGEDNCAAIYPKHVDRRVLDESKPYYSRHKHPKSDTDLTQLEFLSLLYEHCPPENCLLYGGDGDDDNLILDVLDPKNTVKKLIDHQWHLPKFVWNYDI